MKEGKYMKKDMKNRILAAVAAAAVLCFALVSCVNESGDETTDIHAATVPDDTGSVPAVSIELPPVGNVIP